MNTKPNLKAIIDNNLDKTGHIPSKGQSRLPKKGWLDSYKHGGPYASSWMLTNPKPAPVSFPRMQFAGPVSSQDSLRHQAGKMFNFEETKGSPTGTKLDDWGYHQSQMPWNTTPKNWKKPETPKQAVDLYMQEIATNPILGYFPSAMEKGEAGDFLYNSGRDARVYMLDQYLKSKGEAGLPNRGSYNVDTKTEKWTPELQQSLNEQWNNYSQEINKLPTNTRRQLLNKGRDFYYKNTYSADTPGVTYWSRSQEQKPGSVYDNQTGYWYHRGTDGSLSPAYDKTWKPRIWESVNTYENGGDISIPDLDADKWLMKYQDRGEVLLPKIGSKEYYKSFNQLPVTDNLRVVPQKTIEKDKQLEQSIRDSHESVSQYIPNKNPYKKINSTKADIFRSILPVPKNVSQMLSKSLIKDARMSENSLSDDEKIILWNTIQNAKKSGRIDPKTGKPTTGTEYQDYGNQGYGSPDDFNKWFNSGNFPILEGAYNSVTNPGFKLASTIGRGRFWEDQKDPNTIYYTDVYDWNTSEKNFNADNAYKTIRNSLRNTEEKNLNKDKNENYRMNFKLNKAEIDKLKVKKEKNNKDLEIENAILTAFKNGGWLDQYQVGGQDAPLPAIGSKAYYDLQKADRYRTDAIPSRGKQREQFILQNVGQSKIAAQQAAQEAARVAANRESLSQYNPKPGDAEHRRIMAKKYAAEHGGYSDEQGNYHQGLLGNAADSKIANRTWENIIEPGFNAEMVMSGAGLLGKGAKSLGKYAGRNIAESMESGILSNARRINPWAENLNNPLNSYRVTGLDALQDFQKTGVLRSMQQGLPEGATLAERAMNRPTSFPSFQKGYADLRYLPEEGGVIFKTDLPTYKRGEINPVTGNQIRGRHYAHRVIDPKTGATLSEVPGANVKVYGSKPHWLKGYPEIRQPIYSQPEITRGPINYWEQAKFMERNPNFNPEAYTSSVDKFGNPISRELPEELQPKLSSQMTKEEWKKYSSEGRKYAREHSPSKSTENLPPPQQAGFLGNIQEMFSNPKQYFTKPGKSPYSKDFKVVLNSDNSVSHIEAQGKKIGTYGSLDTGNDKWYIVNKFTAGKNTSKPRDIMTVVNNEGNIQNVYKSSGTNSGKTQGMWYPYEGMDKSGWFIKGNTPAERQSYKLYDQTNPRYGRGTEQQYRISTVLDHNFSNIPGKDFRITQDVPYGEELYHAANYPEYFFKGNLPYEQPTWGNPLTGGYIDQSIVPKYNRNLTSFNVEEPNVSRVLDWNKIGKTAAGVGVGSGLVRGLKKEKQGGMITDPRGQWAHPGQNTRIPGNNITMEGVSYPVLAKASNGQQQMMYPGQNYYFPGASHVDEYPMLMQIGGIRLPNFINTTPTGELMKWATHEPTTADAVASIADPFGLSNVPFTMQAFRNMVKEPSLSNAADFGWNLLGQVPLFGKAVSAPGKVKKAVQAEQNISKMEKLGEVIGKPIKYVGKKYIDINTAPARGVNALWKKVGVTPNVTVLGANTFNRGQRAWGLGWDAGIAGLDKAFPGTPEQKYGGSWLNKYK